VGPIDSGKDSLGLLHLLFTFAARANRLTAYRPVNMFYSLMFRCIGKAGEGPKRPEEPKGCEFSTLTISDARSLRLCCILPRYNWNITTSLSHFHTLGSSSGQNVSHYSPSRLLHLVQNTYNPLSQLSKFGLLMFRRSFNRPGLDF
jgi:hypothetical protein